MSRLTAETVAALPEADRSRFYASLTPQEHQALLYRWDFWARDSQLQPPLEVPGLGLPWRTWLILAGRGCGKTRVGAETVRSWVESGRCRRLALVARTSADVRDVVVEGEALATDTPIPTPTGWKQLSEIQVGDRVLTPSGTPTLVTWISEIAENRPCYLVRFSDGSELVADTKHKWFTQTLNERRYATKRGKTAGEVRTTEEIASTLFHQVCRDITNHSIAVAQPLILPHAQLPLEPYLLGAWLGDGFSHQSRIACPDSDYQIIEEIQKFGYTACRVASTGYTKNRTEECGVYVIEPVFKERSVWGAVRDLNILGNKSIPDIYLRASFEQRLQLLQGLMDTDGTVDKRGICTFTGIIEPLVHGVKELCLTLGIRANLTTSDHAADEDRGQRLFKVHFTTCLPVFRLQRKLARLPYNVSSRFRNRYITSIEPVESVPVKCIAVDDPSHLFLAGKNFIATHNSGLLSVCPPSFKPKWEPSKRRLTWPNGAVATTYTGDEPDQLRGPQHDGAWCDELAAWRYPEAWDMLQMGLRLGSTPQAVVTTTPRPTKLIKDLVKDASTVVTRGSTYENRANLAPSFFNFITNRYEGTRLGRQELRAELLEDVPGALWGRDNLDLHRVRTLTKVPQFSRIAVALDPSATKGGDEAGIVCSALEFLTPEQQLERLPHVYVLDDASQQASPQGWASAAVSLFHTRQAHVLVAESNNGGEMVSTTISTIPNAPPVHLIHASLGKQARAEPISGLYEQGRVHHVGAFPQLEDEMCEWVPASGLPSPNRLDALVWSITELVFGEFSIMPSALAGRPRSAGAGRRVVLAR